MPEPPASPDQTMRRLSRLFDRILVCAFVFALTLPAAGALLGWDFYPRTERRPPIAFPSFPAKFQAIGPASARFLAAFDDNFGFRNTLVHKLQNLRLRTGLLTPTPQVLNGRENWLFVRQHPRAVGFTNERGFEPLTESQLDQWQHRFESRDAFFKRRGILYIVAVAPEKQSVHPEYLPINLQPRPPSRLDQLADRLLKTHSPVNFINIQPALRAAASSEILYRQTDSHWNFAGAYYGYRELLAGIARLLPQYHLVPAPRSNFLVLHDPSRAGDLVAVFGLHDELTEPWDHWVLRPDPPRPSQTAVDPPRPRLLMFHDSFADNMIPMMTPHFTEPLFTDSPQLDIALVDAQRPDIVISEFAERTLQTPVPTDPFDPPPP